MHGHPMAEYISIFGALSVSFCSYHWWKDVINEGRFGHHHTEKVRMGLRIGMSLFIISEVMFFFGVFFAYFAASIFPAGILEGLWVVSDGVWPPKGIKTFENWLIFVIWKLSI
jgi:cytochrome c oxidase subunit 3